MDLCFGWELVCEVEVVIGDGFDDWVVVGEGMVGEEEYGLFVWWNLDCFGDCFFVG